VDRASKGSKVISLPAIVTEPFNFVGIAIRGHWDRLGGERKEQFRFITSARMKCSGPLGTGPLLNHSYDPRSPLLPQQGLPSGSLG